MRVLDLFSGACGGWSLGLHRAGYRTVAAAESDPWRRHVFARNFPGVEMFDDVRAVTADALRERLGYLPDVVVGSPPCQDISSANHRGKGVDGERSGLFFEAVRIIGEIRPVWAALENSPNLRAKGADRVLLQLEGAGYSCWPIVVGADHAGANHLRRRVWIVAVRSDAYGQGQHDCPSHDEEMARRSTDGGDDTDAEMLFRSAQPRHQSNGTPEPLRAWQPWNGGAPDFGRVGDGLPKGMARQLLAAYGDAVVPQIPEAIGRVMARLAPTGVAA